MSPTTPLRSLLGGVGLALSIHALLLLNGSVLGISGFLHRAIRGQKEAIVAVLGLCLGGACIHLLEGRQQPDIQFELSRAIITGFLVGLGTKMSNGCTSGHMLAGMSRFSSRSITATCIFFIVGALTTRVFPSDLSPPDYIDWSLDDNGKTLVSLAIAALSIPTGLYLLAPRHPENNSYLLRMLAVLSTNFAFAVSLHLSGLGDPQKVFSFLVLPFHNSFDPSLAFLAAGALPLLTFLYHFCRGPEKARLGGAWSIPGQRSIDVKLIIGAALFGVGWGLSGVCPGPALLNMGRGSSLMVAWLGAFLLGGLVI